MATSRATQNTDTVDSSPVLTHGLLGLLPQQTQRQLTTFMFITTTIAVVVYAVNAVIYSVDVFMRNSSSSNNMCVCIVGAVVQTVSTVNNACICHFLAVNSTL